MPANAGHGNLLASLRQRLEAKRTLQDSSDGGVGLLQPSEEVTSQLAGQQETEEDEQYKPPGLAGMEDSHALQDGMQHLQQLDLVSFDHCQELVQMPSWIEQQVLQQFDASWWGMPRPSHARRHADRVKWLPQEALGLYVPPQPRISDASLYKLEQRLARAQTVDVQRIVQRLQEQFPEARSPAEDAAGNGGSSMWLDENGLLKHQHDPAKEKHERPWRRYDQDEAATLTVWVPAVLAPMQLLDSRGTTYRLDVELGKLEFDVHPYMSLEHQLAAKLLCSFREYHRRLSLGLATFYSQKLAALEDWLLNAREQLFHAQEQGQEVQQVLPALAAVADAEREVAEVRQLQEEEIALMLGSMKAMSELWQQLEDVRGRQRGLRLTDIGFKVVQLPPEDCVLLQADGLTRQQLDIALLVAESEAIAGMPAYPNAFPVNQADAELAGFALRRVESMASSHCLIKAELMERLALLQDRVSADPDDPEIKALQQQLESLGPAPKRLPLTHQQEMELWNWAEEEVAAGRVGVYRPPHMQPCLTLLPASTAAVAGSPRLAAKLGSNTAAYPTSPSAAAVASGCASSCGGITARSRLSLAPAAAQQQQHCGTLQDLQASEGVLKTQEAVTGLESGRPLPVSQQGPKLQVELKYYARLLVNGRTVGTSEVTALQDDFTMDFRDVFSIRMLKWPDSMQLELWEQHTFRDVLVAQFYLAIPGLFGTPHVDPQAKPYSWTSPTPVPQDKLLQAVAALQPLGAVPGVDVSRLQHQEAAAAAGAANNSSMHHLQHRQVQQQSQQLPPSKAGGDGAAVATANAAATTAGGAGLSSRTSKAGRGLPAVYPSGRLFVRCGWVADSGLAPLMTPFEAADGAFAEGNVKPSHLHQNLLMMGPHGMPGSHCLLASACDHDAIVQVGLGRQPRMDLSAASINPLASKLHGSCPGSNLGSSSPDWSRCRTAAGSLSWIGGACSTDGAAGAVFGNPLAHMGQDVEVGPTVAPPLPHVKADRMLHRAAAIGGNRLRGSAAASKWLSQQLLDPNDPKNAILLELLRAREAAAPQGNALGSPGSVPGLFRLDVLGELSLAVDRAGDQRAAFIHQRWQAGPFRGSAASGSSVSNLGGCRQLSITAPLSAKDTLELQDAHREAMALVEAASMGVGRSSLAGTTVSARTAASAAAMAMAMTGRQERALKWAQAALAKAIDAREANIRSFALRIRAACNQLGSGRSLGRRFKTDDVVKDAPLPEFKLDLSSLAAALAPVRPLRPQRRAIKKLQASVPRDTQLVITLQRASNLPCRLGTAGVRAQSPNRMSGAHTSLSNTGRFTSKDQPMPPSSFGRTTRESASLLLRATRGNRVNAASEDGEATGGGAQPERADSAGSLNCFVEVKFRGKVQRTATVDGNVPMWNEQLVFPVIGLEQEASPSALKESDGLVTINIFDEVITPTAAAKAARAAARTGGMGGLESLTEGPALPERERRFLGCLRLPLATIYQAEVLEGALKLEVPPVLLGYLQSNGRPPSLSLYITLKPRLAPPVEANEERLSGEQEDVARHARKWVTGISALPQCRSRITKALAVDPDGVATLLCRFLAAAPLPPCLAAAAAEVLPANPAANPASSITRQVQVEQLDQLLLTAARWVAHVPFLDDSSFGKRRSNVWANNADFVGLAAGDHEEHAHLLAGLFMELQQEAFVVLGTALAGAQAAFVLTTGRLLMPEGSAAAARTAAPQQAMPPAAADTAAGSGSTAAAAGNPSLQPVQQQVLLRQRLQQAAAAATTAQQQQQEAAAASGAATGAAATAIPLAVNPAAAAAAAAAAVSQPFDVLLLRLWNPLTGLCVPVRDPSCELRQVGVVYSPDNIWANIQLTAHPWDMSWNLADQASWRPFFGPVLPPREMASIQVPPSYVDLEPRFYEELEARVEETVRDALYEARSVVVTQPNNKLSRVLKSLLREVPAQLAAINTASMAASVAMSDSMAAVAGPAAAEAARQQLQQRLKLIQALQLSHNERVSREMRGCLINGHILALPFGDGYGEAVSQAVINTGVHRTVDPRVKFAMAAFVEPLGAAFVCCLWIYVAAVREMS